MLHCRCLLRRFSSSSYSYVRLYSSIDNVPNHDAATSLVYPSLSIHHGAGPLKDRLRFTPLATSLVGPRLTLHKHINSLIHSGDLDSAYSCILDNKNKHPQHPLITHTVPTVFTCNDLIAAMNAAKRYNDATTLFSYFFSPKKKFKVLKPNLESYNNLIESYCHTENIDRAIEVYRHILNNTPFDPCVRTYVHLTEVLANAGRMDEAVDLLDGMLEIVKFGEPLVYNNVALGYLKLGDLNSAEVLREEAEQCRKYDGLLHWTIMEWTFKAGDRVKKALKLFLRFAELGYLDYERAVVMRQTLRDAGLENTKQMEYLECFIEEENDKRLNGRETLIEEVKEEKEVEEDFRIRMVY